MELVIGVDAGGTTTRCVLADAAGAHRSSGHAGGINQHSSAGEATTHLAFAIRSALGDVPPATVRTGVLAVAGAGEAGLAKVRGDAERVWSDLGLGGSPLVVPDVVATFASGSTAEAGVALVAGTGAIAAAVSGTELVERADGLGWLLGDIGSAVWLGREAVVAVLAALDGRAPATALTDPVLAALRATTSQDVVATVYAAAPAELGRLAPLLVTAATTDRVADGIVARGVGGLLCSLDAVRRDVGDPVVLGGALLTTDGPVRDGVLRGLAERGVTSVATAADATDGAVRLARRRLYG